MHQPMHTRFDEGLRFTTSPTDVMIERLEPGDGPAEIVQFQWPGGFHVAYAKLAAAFEAGPPDAAVLADISARDRITLHGPPLARLAAG